MNQILHLSQYMLSGLTYPKRRFPPARARRVVMQMLTSKPLCLVNKMLPRQDFFLIVLITMWSNRLLVCLPHSTVQQTKEERCLKIGTQSDSSALCYWFMAVSFQWIHKKRIKKPWSLISPSVALKFAFQKDQPCTSSPLKNGNSKTGWPIVGPLE